MQFIYEDHRVYVVDASNKVIVNATFPFIKDNVVNVNHTFVDPELRGQGVASTLMHHVYDHAKKLGYKMVATCPYAVIWFKRNKDKNDIIDEQAQSELSPECQI
jgi:uncharacterized protein